MFKWLLKLGVLALCLWVPVTTAGQFNVSPVKLTLPAKAKSTSVTVTNTGKQVLGVRLRLYAWDKDAGQDRLMPASDLILTPPVLKLQPGRSQVVRIGRPSDIPVPEIEKTYRLVVTELALPKDDKTPPAQGMALRSVLEVSIPLFVPPARMVKDLQWTLDAGPAPALTVFNAGTVHSKLKSLRLLDAGGAVLAEHPAMLYALPRQSSRLELQYRRKPRAAEPLRLEYRADNALQTIELKAPGG